MNPQDTDIQGTGLEIAVIGMAARFPGARTIADFWDNLKHGRETIAFFSDEELKNSGIGSQLLEDTDYIKAKGVIGDIEYFDAPFFDYIPREAETLDPQIRVFHECAWEALENAGYDPDSFPGWIGLYAGANPNPYWESVCSVVGSGKPSEQLVANQLYDRDYVASRTSYKLGLKGTTFSLFTACSTSMTAIHLACIGILGGECDMALAGGISIILPERAGYLYEDGMILSPDGHNRTFDEKAAGSVLGDGVGVVVLRNLRDAVDNGDTVYAVVKGSALNNDGNRKLGYTAPSVEGQTEVIQAAMEMAEVEPESITYLEAHGTATPLGDVVEMEALHQTFGRTNQKSCAIGSVKSNVGHLNIASGVSGFIKTVLALKHKQIPPSLHYTTPNPKIDFDNSPFYVNTCLQEWKSNGYPLRAGVSSFGIGGTNVHVILEEAPRVSRQLTVDSEREKNAREYQLILLSAKTQSALDKMTKNLAEYFNINLLNHGNHENPINPGQILADAAYTLQVGRRVFPHRRMAVCSNIKEAADILSSAHNRNVHSFLAEEKKKGAIFMFAGLGDQYVDMGRELYEKEPVFQREMNRCFEILKSLVDYDIKEILYPTAEGNRSNKSYESYNSHTSPINQTEIAQITVFSIEYALARLLLQWGIEPRAMIGYSFGEYAAACIAGVMSLEDALRLVVARGQLMSRIDPGAMLSVPLPFEQLKPLIDMDNGLSIAIDNGPSCIIAGPPAAVEVFEKQVKEQRLICIHLETTQAVHSPMMEPILAEFQEVVNKIALNSPRIPYISNVSGDWLTTEQAVSPGYWVQHLRQTVRFSGGLSRLMKKEDAVFLEIGPGRALSNHLKQQENGEENRYLVVNFLRHPEESSPDHRYLLNKIGYLWLWGIKIDWTAFNSQEKRNRISLPAYPFEQQRFWKESPVAPAASASDLQGEVPSAPAKQANISQWFYYPSWQPARLPEENPAEELENQQRKQQFILLFLDECGLGQELAVSLEAVGHQVIPVEAGTTFTAPNGKDPGCKSTYTIDPCQQEHYRMLLEEIDKRHQKVPDRIFYLWGVTNSRERLPGVETIDSLLDRCFYYLAFLAGAIGSLDTPDDIHLLVVTDNMQDVTGEEALCPGKAPAAVISKVISQEYSNIICRSIDILLPDPGREKRKKLVVQLTRELTGESSHLEVVFRGNYRWVQAYEPVSLPGSVTRKSRLKSGGVYLITGGLGGIGHVLACHLAVKLGAKLILTIRTELPGKDQWNQWLTTHPEEDPMTHKIKKVQELEALGAEVLVIRADAADEGQMRGAISRAEERFGTINGVFHTAGIVGQNSMCTIDEIDKHRCQSNFQPKIHGLLVLEKVLRGKKPDFCMLMSSISSVLAGLGLAAYASANRFMDLFTRLLNRESPVPWLSVNWDGWRTPGQPKEEDFSAASWEDFAMTPEEGIESVERLLSMEELGHGHVVHSTGHLQARIHQWLDLESLRQKQGPDNKKKQASSYARPDLSNPYIAPKNKIEAIIVGVWQEFLGIHQVGTDDNFFDLNATSLDIVRVNSILRGVLKENIPAVTMFKYPTAAALARFLSREVETGEASRSEPQRKEILQQGYSRVENIRKRVKRN